MAGRLAIVAGSGGLPLRLHEAHPDAYCVTLAGTPHELPEGVVHTHRPERLGELLEDLRDHDVTDVVMAGAMARPKLEPSALDAVTAKVAPALMAAMQQGDDGLLRHVIALFEDRGFTVVGAHELVAGLTVPAGMLCGKAPDSAATLDVEFGLDILSALSPLDLGQATVVAGGLCLGIETLQGTDALLEQAAGTPAHKRPEAPGVLVKLPKRGQDLRVDMPAIGPTTIEGARRAGLGGIVIAADRVLVLEREATLAAAREAGLFVQALDV